MRYEPGDVLRYTVGSRTVGLAAGEYARVAQVDGERNQLTVTHDSGQTVTYDPRRLQGVTVYREAERALAVGDRVQITAPDRAQYLANRELGTIQRLDRGDEQGALHVRLDSGRNVAFALDQPLHLDLGYAFTSHSSQGQTAERVLVHVDAERASQALVNRQFAYVALSRSRSDVQIYTNDRIQLPDALGREHVHASALERSMSPGRSVSETPSTHKPTQRIEHGMGFSR